MKSRAAGVAAGVFLFVFCFLSGGCLHDNNTAARREASFSPYAEAKVGDVSLREFMRARSAVVFDGNHLSVGTNSGEFRVNGNISSIGSAAAIDRRGYFLTAAHCVQKGPFLMVSLGQGRGAVQPARIVWRGDESKNQPDLALLQVPFPQQEVFEWAPEFTNGERMVAAGINVLSNAVVRQCMSGRILRLDTNAETVLPHCICVTHDAPLRPGDSGGPLVSTNGRLVGINNNAIIGRPHWVSFSVETLSSEAERPDLEWLRNLIDKDAAVQGVGIDNRQN